ncbi:MAG TPA: hypothetical protein VGO52_26400 [Hyphomonadaceae bacterium]|jgi:hypothetical protein|nr:hypothetical protein [Hyphomonadaceae bacterium]
MEFQKIEVRASDSQKYSEGTLTQLFGQIVSIKNSERAVIWQRWSAMLVANSVILATIDKAPIPKAGIALVGIALCAAWRATSLRGWKIYDAYLDAAASFVWVDDPSIGNVVHTVATSFKKTDWIKHSAFLVIWAFMASYVWMLHSELVLYLRTAK